ncbi:hypothetical protein CNN00395 [Cryptococcus deneoformans JEC21]|uniref:Uncharacterized protein n=1 Tax=Cryptococcus deneoformans (strain JEC21 / ATCC MYA-565) TaxID=214684 RepID=A0A0S2M671_CRYD1|nr:hypothetical protein CNN00395 [Cryptococcus neoformans var. neoformans JEC21]ALO69798.1 hypothetical protein CNN00395 [Cryptococcus neoformans var. neoformans JEC21]
MSNLHRYDKESSSSGQLYEGDPFLEGIMNMALGDLETTPQSTSIPQHQISGVQPFWSQASTAAVPPRHLTETYRCTAPSIQQDQQQPYDHQKDTGSWTTSSQPLAFANSTHPSGPYHLRNHSRIPSLTLSDGVSRGTHTQWQGSSTTPTFGSVHPPSLGPPGPNWSYDCSSLGLPPFSTSFEDMTASISRGISIHHGEEASTASMSKLSPLASPFIPFGQDKVEEEKDDVSSGNGGRRCHTKCDAIISHLHSPTHRPNPKPFIYRTSILPLSRHVLRAQTKETEMVH